MILRKPRVYLDSICMIFFGTVSVCVLAVLRLISPRLAKKITIKVAERSTMPHNPLFKYEDWGPTFASFTFLKSIVGNAWHKLGQEAFVGAKAPDTPVVTLEGDKSSILNFMKGEFSPHINPLC